MTTSPSPRFNGPSIWASISWTHLPVTATAIDTKLTEEDLVRRDAMFPPGVAAGDRARDMDRVNI
jgi:hypothetical protein